MKEVYVSTDLNLPSDVEMVDRATFMSLMFRCADSALWHHADAGAESDLFTDEEAAFLGALVRANK